MYQRIYLKKKYDNKILIIRTHEAKNSRQTGRFFFKNPGYVFLKQKWEKSFDLRPIRIFDM